MAIRIPTLDGPEVRQQGTPLVPTNINVSPDAMGAAVMADAFKGLGAVAGKLSDVYFQAQKDADEAAVQEALNRQKLANDANLQTLKQAQLKDAAGASQAIYGQVDKTTAQLAEGLANDRQRRLFAVHANKETVEFRKLSEAYVGEQNEKFHDSEDNGALGLALSRSAANADNTTFVDKEVSDAAGVVQRYAERKGLGPLATESAVREQVGKLRQAQIAVLLGREQYPLAMALISANRETLGSKADDLEKIAQAGDEQVRADAFSELACRDRANLNRDGTVNGNRVRDYIDKLLPPGKGRELAWKYASSRIEQSMAFRKEQEGQNWDAGLGSYLSQSQDPKARDILRIPRPTWNSLTPDQQLHLEHLMHADRQAQEGEPLTDAQHEALGSLENDLAEKDEYWGSVGVKELMRDPRWQILPERYRIQMQGKQAQLHQDRSNPEAVLRSFEHDMKARAMQNDVLDAEVAKKPYDQWDEETKNNWRIVQDEVAPLVMQWRTDHKGQRVPKAVIDQFVNDVTRKGHIVDGGWFWFDVTSNRVSSARRTPEQQGKHEFVPEFSDEERDSAAQSLLQQGYDPKVTPQAFTPAGLEGELHELHKLSGGPSPADRPAFEQYVREQGKEPTPEAVQAAYVAFHRHWRKK